MALSPWPTSPVALTNATTILRQVLPDGLDDARVQRLGKMAADRVESYSPGAPQNTKDTAVELYAGYINQARRGNLSKLNTGGIDLEFGTFNFAAAFRHSGAMALLSPYKVRRAGAIS